MSSRSRVGPLLEALGQFSRDNWWLIPVLAFASSLATFLLAEPRVAVTSTIVILVVLLLAAIASLARARSASPTNPALAEDAESIEVPAVVGTPPAEDGRRESPPSTIAAPDHSDRNEDDDAPASAFKMASEGDITGLRQFMDQELTEVQEGPERNGRQAMFEALLVLAGDTGAFRRLRSMVDDKRPPMPAILSWYASALSIMGEPREAAKALDERSATFSVNERAEALIQAARFVAARHALQEAAELVEPLLDDVDVSEINRATAYDITAEALKERSPLQAMAAYERSLTLYPADAETRFNLAYLYSEHNLDALAFHHYRVLNDTNQAGAVTFNNLAVAESRLGMPGRALRHYREAGEKGSALGWSNLAQALMNSGAYEEAEAAIKRGEELNSDEKSVPGARERLIELRAKDAETAASFSSATWTVVRSSVSTALDAGDGTTLAEGLWRLSTGQVVALKKTTSGMTSLKNDDGCKLTLKPQADIFTVEYVPRSYASSRSGWAIPGSGEQMLLIVPSETNSSNESPLITADRIQDTLNEESA